MMGRPKGYKATEETRRKISIALKGKLRSDEHRKNLSISHKGHKHTEEHKKKISASLNGIKRTENFKLNRLGNKNPNWQGGISFEPYSIDWRETLKRAIRERDRYLCQLCFSYGNTVHHIDYNKRNCNLSNLITLCKECNSKVNFNRKYWQNYFQGKVI